MDNSNMNFEENNDYNENIDNLQFNNIKQNNVASIDGGQGIETNDDFLLKADEEVNKIDRIALENRTSMEKLLDFIKSDTKKFIMIVLGIILLIIFLFIVLPILFNSKNKKYREYEAKIVEYASDFIWLERIEIENGKWVDVTFNDLVESNLMINDIEMMDECDGYILIKNINYNYKYEPYLSCNKYKTKGYGKYPNEDKKSNVLYDFKLNNDSLEDDNHN